MTTANEWIQAFAAELGAEPPTQEEIDALLGLAGIAAHASERTAAPLSTWLAGRASIDPSVAREAASRVAVKLATDR
jgi:hypothetical protein